MASLAFAGTTLWNDGTTGVGRVAPRMQTPAANYIYRRIPRQYGLIVKQLGGLPRVIEVVCQWSMTQAQRDALDAAIAGVREDEGSLSLPSGESWNHCRLLEPPELVVGDAERVNASATATRRVTGHFVWIQVRP